MRNPQKRQTLTRLAVAVGVAALPNEARHDLSALRYGWF
jgi:hypothetical protein